MLVRASSDVISSDNRSDLDSFSDFSGQEYSLLDNTEHSYNDEEDWSPTNGMSFGGSTFCYSTPMATNLEPNIYNYVNNVDSFNTVFSNSDLYKTAVDYNKDEENKDVEISSSLNGTIDISECNLYENFIDGRSNSTIDEDGIIELEKTLMYASNSHAFSIDNDKANGNTINDNTILQKNISFISNNSSSTNEPCFKNDKSLTNNTVDEEDEENDNQVSDFANRTLLDESGYTESILNTDL